MFVLIDVECTVIEVQPFMLDCFLNTRKNVSQLEIIGGWTQSSVTKRHIRRCGLEQPPYFLRAFVQINDLKRTT